MDSFFKHLAPLARRYPTGMPVQSIGYFISKQQHIDHAFPSFNVSLILKGEGTYMWQGKQYAVKAPCVITQWPGIRMNYGPLPGTTWDELFIIYNPETVPVFEARKLLSPECPFWSIQREEQVFESIATLSNLVRKPPDDGFVDRVDRLCEWLILETHLGTERHTSTSRMEKAIQSIRKHIQDHLFAKLDYEQLARDHGLSASTFRRYWKLYMHVPPARYVSKLRIRAACRMLVETDLSISEIARQTGFEDAFYFSRCFRGMMRIAPRTYRQRHQGMHALPPPPAGIANPVGE